VFHPKPLRGTAKLAYAITAFGLELSGMVALDLGAAAGDFTKALLDAGVVRLYAVDVRVAQLRGSLRIDYRVVNLERTNLSTLDRRVVPEPVDVVVMDHGPFLPVRHCRARPARRALPGAQRLDGDPRQADFRAPQRDAGRPAGAGRRRGGESARISPGGRLGAQWASEARR
jgi:hypothetical protein